MNGEIYVEISLHVEGLGLVRCDPATMVPVGCPACADEAAEQELKEAHALIDLLMKERETLVSEVVLARVREGMWRAAFQQLAAHAARLQRSLLVLRALAALRG